MLIEEFKLFIARNGLLEKENKVLLAVSGGIDSVVMAHLFIRLGTKIAIAHCNFCLRGDESDKDEDFVRHFAEENGVPFYSVRFGTKDFAAENGISIQMAARQLRYEWFEKIRKENSFTSVAIAHNLNDNIETMIINLTRGTGLTGLTGIRVSGNRIIRPLLFASRLRITEYCNFYSIPYREDKSNAETKYARNKIRHLVIPVLKEINPSVEETLNETASRLAGIDEILSGYVSQILTTISRNEGKNTIINIKKLREVNPSDSLIFELFSRFEITGATLPDLKRLFTGKTGKQIFTRTHRLLRNRDEIIITPAGSDSRFLVEINNIDDFNDVEGVKSARITENSKDFKIPDSKTIAAIDLEKAAFPFIVRNWRIGDYFYPLGMKEKKKISDYFIDRKYSRVEKEMARILESGGNVVWIIGERPDDRCKITSSTTKILIVEAGKE